MTLLTIVQEMCYDVGLDKPTSVASNTAREMQEALTFANEAGEELARRFDWGTLTATETLTGDGTFQTYTLPAAFSRLTPGAAVKAGTTILRPLSRSEWNLLTGTEATPRYYLLEGQSITLWPYLANASTATVTYQTRNWCSAGQATWAADGNTSLIPESLFAKALIVRWRRQKGMDYADQEAEYEAALAEFASFDRRGRA